MAETRTLAVIPARLASTRLLRKVLREIAGRPMLAWVYDAARACKQLDEVVIATDSEEVSELCEKNNWPYERTSPDLPSGTDRVHAVAQRRPAEIYINIQGDEPLLNPTHIAALIAPFAQAHVDVTTLKVACSPENITNPNAVKVVTALDGRALYFSRATIPYDRDESLRAAQGRRMSYKTVAPAPTLYWKHIGLYAYRRVALNRFAALAPSHLEQTERLEQLRLLENGFNLYVSPTDQDTIGVDTEEDLRRVEAILRRIYRVD